MNNKQTHQQAAPANQFDAEGFRAWVLRNLPDDTIISNGAWWANHLTEWAQRFAKAAPQQAAEFDDEDDACPTCGEDGGTSCGMPNCGLLSQAPQQEVQEPVFSVHKAHLKHGAGPWCKEALLYSPDNEGDYPENRVMLYTAQPAPSGDAEDFQNPYALQDAFLYRYWQAGFDGKDCPPSSGPRGPKAWDQGWKVRAKFDEKVNAAITAARARLKE